MTSSAPSGDPMMDDAINSALNSAMNEAILNEALNQSANQGNMGDSVMVEEEELILGPDDLSEDRLPGILRALGLAAGGLALTGGLVFVGMQLLRDRGIISRLQVPDLKLNGLRRGARVEVRPRTVIFSPNLTITLPFSSVVEQRESGREATKVDVMKPMRDLGDTVGKMGQALPWVKDKLGDVTNSSKLNSLRD